MHDVSVLLCLQRALLEQKQRRKRQEPLMVQPNSEGRPRRSRPRRSEEQAPLVEPHLSTASDIILDGEDLKGQFTQKKWRFVVRLGAIFNI